MNKIQWNESPVKGLRNCRILVPGTSVVAYLARFDSTPHKWTYTLWDETDSMIGSDTLDLSGLPWEVTPVQVANVAFALEVDYA